MLKKITSSGIGLLLLVSPIVASADALSDLQAQIQMLLAQIAQLKAQTGAGAAVSASSASCVQLAYNMGPDDTDADTNGDVTKLQRFLAQDPSIYPEGRVTGYFGPATTRAVQRWQKTHGLVSSGDPDSTGYGYVGPRTRAAMACASAATSDSRYAPTVDLKINGSDGPFSKAAGYATFTWNSTNADYCTASGDTYWNSSKLRNGSESVWTGNEKTGVTTYTITCGSSGGGVNSATDRVTISFNSEAPVVITSTSAKAASNFEADAGGELSILGNNLATVDSTSVYIGGIQASVTWTSATRVDIRVPSSLATRQTHDLYVVNQYGKSNIVRIKILGTYGSGLTPVITSTGAKAASNFEADAGGYLTIYGRNFRATHGASGSGQLLVRFSDENMNEAAQIVSSTNEMIEILVPSFLVPGRTYNMYVITGNGTSDIVRIKILSTLGGASTLTIKSPLANYGLTRNIYNLIQWSTTGISSSASVYIQLVGPMGIVYLVAQNVPNSGSYSLFLNQDLQGVALPDGTYSIKICAWSSPGMDICDIQGPILFSDKG